MVSSRIFLLFGALSLGLLPIFASAFDYCTKTCDEENSPHTMCETYFPKGGGSACSEYTMGLNVTEKERIMVYHNKLRQKIANGGEKNFPKASNMMVLGWSKEAAEIAQRWADQCGETGHDKCRDTIKHTIGQNLAGGTYFTSQGANLTGMVQKWYDEISDYSMPETPEVYKWTPGTGHFSQVIWASTYAVGCGIRRTYTKPIGKVLLACNYLPAGNYLGDSMYKPGTPCSACPTGSHCSKKYPGLCTYNKDDK